MSGTGTPSPADILLMAMANVKMGINALISILGGFGPQLKEYVMAAKEMNTTTEMLVDTIEKEQKLREGREQKRRLKVEPPDNFDGMPKNTIPFTQACVFYFEAMEIGEKEIQAKITFALSKTKGGVNGVVTAWANQQRALIMGKTDVYQSWITFMEALHSHFSLQDDAAEAIHKIHMIKSSAEPIPIYATTFKMYQTQSRYNDVVLIEEYRRGLNDTLEERCHMIYPKPKTLEDWIT